MFWAELVIFNWSLLIGLLLRVTLISALTKETFAVVKPSFFFPHWFCPFPFNLLHDLPFGWRMFQRSGGNEIEFARGGVVELGVIFADTPPRRRCGKLLLLVILPFEPMEMGAGVGGGTWGCKSKWLFSGSSSSFQWRGTASSKD